MKVRLLRDIAHIQTGPFGSQLHKKDYVVGGIPIVTVEHLGSRRFTVQNLPSVNEADSERLSRYRMKAGDIIFSRVGSVDRCSLASAENDGWLYSGRCLRVRTKSDWSSDFLYYYLSSARMKKMIRSIAVGATMPSINTSLLGEVLIPQMPLKKQVAIASVLSAIDERIELNSRLNGYLEELVNSEFAKRFDSHGPKTPLKNVLSISTKSLNPQRHVGEVWEHYSIPAFDATRWPNTVGWDKEQQICCRQQLHSHIETQSVDKENVGACLPD